MELVPFQTRARTIDHLGREQIADCPTAITELWKNAYDAYARHVALHIFDGNVPVAAIVDDGHGMNKTDILGKWLTVGTESKIGNTDIPKHDRNGLDRRTRQGQKGIGRLSSGAMGSFLLLISKKTNEPMTAALIDWRLFENPYLMLNDVTIPVAEFATPADLLQSIPEMFDALIDNVWPKKPTSDRAKRIIAAWQMFSSQEQQTGKLQSTADEIASLIVSSTFEERHLREWPVWQGIVGHGTALFMCNLNHTLLSLTEQDSSNEDDQIESKKLLFETLSGFRDPFEESTAEPDFDYKVIVWRGCKSNDFVSNDRPIDRAHLRLLEHCIEGSFDEQGVFHGTVRAFGNNLGAVTVTPPPGYRTPSPRSAVGPFELCLGTFEGNLADTTHTREEHARLKEQASRYGGLAVYRDSLRVMPYGRTDNDFFKIEERRGKHAGREFWASRQIFGRVAITQAHNQNLRDKAGREGLIDNAARLFMRSLVVHFLMTTAREYFGASSTVRRDRLPLIQVANAKKAEEEAKKAKRISRSAFRMALRSQAQDLVRRVETLAGLKADLNIAIKAKDGETLAITSSLLDEIQANKGELRLPPRPRNLGALEDDYFDYKMAYTNFCTDLEHASDDIHAALQKYSPRPPREIAYSASQRHAKALHDHIRKWKTTAITLLSKQEKLIVDTATKDNKLYDAASRPLLDKLDNNQLSLAETLCELDLLRDNTYAELSDFYDPLLRSLRQLAEGVDLDTASGWERDQSEQMAFEVEQFTELAQLGITVELISHELERLDHTIGEHLTAFPIEIQKTDHFHAVSDAHHELVERLRFLSPLKLSGASRTRTRITGQMIAQYVQKFFASGFKNDAITFAATPAFLGVVLEEYRSRIFPVFINLITNARYWVCQNKGDRKIRLDFIDGMVIVADSGPGIPEKDQEHLFELFFTRRISGRGVGLYLCKTNLARGNHTIRYAHEKKLRPLSGASFAITFEGLANEF